MMVWFGKVVEAVPLIEEYFSYEAAGMSIRFGSLKAKKAWLTLCLKFRRREV